MDTNKIKSHREKVVVRFSGDSGDGMQLAGSIFSEVVAILGNQFSTFPDFPPEIRAPRGTLAGVSGFQVQIGSVDIYTPGDQSDVLVAMNPAALKVYAEHLKHNAVVIIDADSFTTKDLEKAGFKTDQPIEELGLTGIQLFEVPLSTMVSESLKDSGLDAKDIAKCHNMFALGLVLWLFNKDISPAEDYLARKFSKKADILCANLKVLTEGFYYGDNTHAAISTFIVDKKEYEAGRFLNINGNHAVALGLAAAAERAGHPLLMAGYPITPATDILQHLAKLKHMNIKTVQAEDEIAAISMAIGASYAGALGVTATSGPGLALKSEALGFAVMAELPLVVVDVQRGGPSTGMPTKSEQTDLLQALYGRNGESPVVVMAATTFEDCFYSAYMAAKIALEHMTPVVLLTDGYLANGSSPWRVPIISQLPEINPPYVEQYYKGDAPWTPYMRDPETLVRYWAIPGVPGFTHRVGGLEKNSQTGVISSEPDNHDLMVQLRDQKIRKVRALLPDIHVEGDEDAEAVMVSWGSTYGHLTEVQHIIQESGRKVAHLHIKYIHPLCPNVAAVLSRYPKVVVIEQNLGMFAKYLKGEIPGLSLYRINKVKGQPFKVQNIAREVMKIMDGLTEEESSIKL